MSVLVFNNPFPTGLVYVISSESKVGTTTIASLSQSDSNMVMDIGRVEDTEAFLNEVSEMDVQFIYVHKDEVEPKPWVLELCKTKTVVFVNYNKLLYSQKDWELMKTNHELLLELETLLPEDSLVRAKRDEIRAMYD